ncbi:MAG TPA: potassium channel family protein [Acidisphaera sp.]|nr:potassium channel family protein [Acidisphaera sp.]
MFDRSEIATRHVFYRAFGHGLRIAWPIISLLLLLKVILGVVVGAIEHWGMWKGISFAFVTGLTIGYGDVVPSSPATRVLAIVIGVVGILMTGLVLAVAVRAMQVAAPYDGERGWRQP